MNRNSSQLPFLHTGTVVFANGPEPSALDPNDEAADHVLDITQHTGCRVVALLVFGAITSGECACDLILQSSDDPRRGFAEVGRVSATVGTPNTVMALEVDTVQTQLRKYLRIAWHRNAKPSALTCALYVVADRADPQELTATTGDITAAGIVSRRYI